MKKLILLFFFIILLFPSFSEAATFGYTTQGATVVATYFVAGCKFASPAESGSISKITQYTCASGAYTLPLGTAVYSDVSGVPTSRLAIDSGNTTLSNTANWYDVNISYNFNASTNYWLCHWAANPSISNQYQDYSYDTGATNQRFYTTGATYSDFENWPATIPATITYSARILSIYATYEAGGAAPYINRSQIIEEE